MIKYDAKSMSTYNSIMYAVVSSDRIRVFIQNN